MKLFKSLTMILLFAHSASHASSARRECEMSANALAPAALSVLHNIQAASRPTLLALAVAFLVPSHGWGLDRSEIDQFLARQRAALVAPNPQGTGLDPNRKFVAAMDTVRCAALANLGFLPPGPETSLVALVLFKILPQGATASIAYQLVVNPEPVSALLADRYFVSQALAASVFLKEGATIADLQSHPAFYARLDHAMNGWKSSSVHPSDADSIREAASLQVEAESVGYRLVADYLARQGISSPVLRSWLQVQRDPHVIPQSLRVLSLLEAMESTPPERREEAIRRNVFDVDLRQQFPALFKAARKVIEKCGDGFLFENRTRALTRKTA